MIATQGVQVHNSKLGFDEIQDEGQGVLHSSKSMMMIIDKICMDIIFF
jgi:hypothetical protein